MNSEKINTIHCINKTMEVWANYIRAGGSDTSNGVYMNLLMEKIAELYTASCPDCGYPNNGHQKSNDDEGYDFIAGTDIKQHTFVYVSKNGKVYPYNKLAYKTRDKEVIVDGEPTYPKDVSGLKLFQHEIKESSRKKVK